MIKGTQQNELEMNSPNKQFISRVKRFKQELYKQHEKNCYTLNAWTCSVVSNVMETVGLYCTLHYMQWALVVWRSG